MSVLDRAALEGSPLADLHAIASELSIDGYRRLRRPDLIEAILAKQSGEVEEPDAVEPDRQGEDEPAGSSELTLAVADELRVQSGEPRRRRGRRGGRGRGGAREDAGERQGERAPAAAEEEAARAAAEDEEARDEGEDEGARDEGEDEGARDEGEDEGARDEGEDEGARGESGEEAAAEPGEEAAAEAGEDAAAEAPTEESRSRTPDDLRVEGVVELLPNSSGFLRVAPPEPSDDDVYISAAQVKRCELVSGDRISGPRRAPRRSERFASLVRIDTINDRPAEEVADSARFDDLPATFPNERLQLGSDSDDPTLTAIDSLAPLGKGSRATIVGRSRAGKSEALRRLAAVLARDRELELSVVLAGVRPEELSEWAIEPAATVSLAASADAQGQTVERVIDQARRLAARGADAVVLIDTLDGLHPHVARKQLAAARNLLEGGSLTVIATVSEPLGGETSVIALDRALTASGRFPALDLLASGTVRPELLVGEGGAEAMARTRAAALDGAGADIPRPPGQ